MRNHFINLSFMLCCFLYSNIATAQPNPSDNLQFDSLATLWDEGMPLDNGWLGELIWKEDNKLLFYQTELTFGMTDQCQNWPIKIQMGGSPVK